MIIYLALRECLSSRMDTCSKPSASSFIGALRIVSATTHLPIIREQFLPVAKQEVELFSLCGSLLDWVRMCHVVEHALIVPGVTRKTERTDICTKCNHLSRKRAVGFSRLVWHRALRAIVSRGQGSRSCPLGKWKAAGRGKRDRIRVRRGGTA